MTPPTNPPSASHGHHDDPLHNEDVAHEHSDINVRAVLMFIVGLAGITALAAAAMWGVFVVLENQAADNDPQLSPLSAPAGQVPPEPRLLTNEPAALDKARTAEQKMLQGYGWVDQPAGVAHVPIGEAKKLLMQRGIATRTGEPLDPRLGTRRSAMADAASGRHAVVPQKALATQEPGAQQPGAQPPAAKPAGEQPAKPASGTRKPAAVKPGAH